MNESSEVENRIGNNILGEKHVELEKPFDNITKHVDMQGQLFGCLKLF